MSKTEGEIEKLTAALEDAVNADAVAVEEEREKRRELDRVSLRTVEARKALLDAKKALDAYLASVLK